MLKKSICWECRWAWQQEHNFVNHSMKKHVKKLFDSNWKGGNIECHKVDETAPFYEPSILFTDAEAPESCSYLLEQLMK